MLCARKGMFGFSSAHIDVRSWRLNDQRQGDKYRGTLYIEQPRQPQVSEMGDTKYAPAPVEPPPAYETAAQPTPQKPAPLRAPLPLDLPIITSIRGKRCILASASPRRRQLLAQVSTDWPSFNHLQSRLTTSPSPDRSHKPRDNTFTAARKSSKVSLPLRICPPNRHAESYARLRLPDRQHRTWRTRNCARRRHSRCLSSGPRPRETKVRGRSHSYAQDVTEKRTSQGLHGGRGYGTFGQCARPWICNGNHGGRDDCEVWERHYR